MPDDPSNPLKQIFEQFAEKLHDVPGKARLARLAKTAKHIPEQVLDDLAALILQLNDLQLVGNDISIALLEVGFCDVKYTDATEFAAALRSRLKRYVQQPRVADSARNDFQDRRRWWGMALSRAAELCRWPAIVLMETCSGA
jgi:hypothetical protein